MKPLVVCLSAALLCFGTSVRAADADQIGLYDSSNGIEPVAWFYLMVEDTQRAEIFYNEIFGWEFAFQQNGYIVIHANGKSIGGLMRATRSGNPGGVSVYFPVSDLDDVLAKATRRGARIILKPMPIPGGRGIMALFTDLDGNPIGLIQAERN